MVQEISLKGIKVFIDPGHGGKKSRPDISGSEIGATGYHGSFVEEDGVYEKDINLSISLKLKNLLRQKNIEVEMSRTTDEVVSLEKRANMIKSFNPDLVVSVHNNAINNPEINGTMVLYPPRGNTDGTKILAQMMSTAIAQKLGTKSLGGRQRQDLYLFGNTSQPIVLTECVFMTNPREEELILQEENQQLAAEGIYEAIIKWLTTGGGKVANRPILPTDIRTLGILLPYDDSPFIEDIQRALSNQGYEISIDGDYGPGTAGTLQDFITANNLEQELSDLAGEIVAGCETYKALGLDVDRVFPRQFPELPEFDNTYNTLVGLQETRPKLFQCREGLSPLAITAGVIGISLVTWLVTARGR